ncbi:MAG: hypothetical protein GVY20_06150, partial [Bacteroidetes bacterium]|nr:hypothetical protein [Bacteroidota bacterium]
MNNIYSIVLVATSILFSLQEESNDFWQVVTQEQWDAAYMDGENIAIRDGFVKQEGDVAVFRSKLKQFNSKRSAKSVVFKQSDQWLNWMPIKNIGPSNLGDAPVVLAKGP